MFDMLDNLKNYGGITLIILSLLAIFVSGIFFGITYYVMDITEASFQANDCDIPNNVLVSSCQELWSLSLYPFFALKDLFIWFSFFFIFAMVLGMFIVGYQSGHSPVLLGLFMIFIIVLTYAGIEMSNVYRTMIEVDIFRDMMLPFGVYNRVMLNFPWFVFFVGLISSLLGIVNYQKGRVNKMTDVEELNY